ncbi:MAG: hypothetical protein J3R72DRAFT_492791 [Linnemannia gamsii]|nr:MAG: hypothetical protein J3R72DRAFT_492791 [Linnemannia gamsii]
MNLEARAACIRHLESPMALDAFENHVSSIRSINLRPNGVSAGPCQVSRHCQDPIRTSLAENPEDDYLRFTATIRDRLPWLPGQAWTVGEHRHWENLGKFYTQIGSLTELEILDLKTVERINERGEPPNIYFPGFFALEDVGKGEIGYFSQWAGLVKLRNLRGLVKWTVPLVVERIGKRENATFVLRNNNGLIGAGPIRGYLRNLEKKRPELKFSYKA